MIIFTLAMAMAVTVPQSDEIAVQALLGGEAPKAGINYKVTETDVEFSAYLPAGWTFTIAIDGDQNGIWGNGAGRSAAKLGPTADRTFGQDSRNGVFCAQTILAASEDDPDRWAISSDCDGYSSKGHVEMGQLDSYKNAKIILKIPKKEIFGEYASSRLQICIWNMRETKCKFSLKSPLVIKSFVANELEKNSINSPQ